MKHQGTIVRANEVLSTMISQFHSLDVIDFLCVHCFQSTSVAIVTPRVPRENSLQPVAPPPVGSFPPAAPTSGGEPGTKGGPARGPGLVLRGARELELTATHSWSLVRGEWMRGGAGVEG